MFRHKKKYHFSILLGCYFFLLNKAAYAYNTLPSLGQAAGNLLEPVSVFTGGFYKLCYILGATLIVGAVLQYKNYRDNPSAVRFSTPIVLFLLGLAFVLLPVISMVSPASQATVSDGNSFAINQA